MDDLIAQNFPAHIHLGTDRATPAQLQKKLSDVVRDPAILDQYPPVFWTAEISSNTTDAYATRMAPSTLKNFAADATAGVAFQNAHRTDDQDHTLGRSLMARYIGPNAEGRPDGVAAVEADFYTLRGLKPSADMFLNDMMAGIANDVSVGFHGGWYRCALCNRDMFDYSDWQNACPHVPGMRYPVFDKAGKATDERVLATADIEDARLAEVSTVYSGATPGASILIVKARQLSDAGKLDPERARILEARYRINLPGAHRAFAGFTPSKEAPVGETVTQERTPATEERATPPTEERAIETRIAAATTAREGDIRAALATVGLSCEGDDLLAAIRSQGASLTELRARADDGTAYRADLITQVLDEGVRAFGPDYERDQEKAELEGLPLASIKRRQANYAKVAAKTFPGGRQTTEEGGDGAHGARSVEADATPVGTINPREAARFRTPGR